MGPCKGGKSLLRMVNQVSHFMNSLGSLHLGSLEKKLMKGYDLEEEGIPTRSIGHHLTLREDLLLSTSTR